MALALSLVQIFFKRIAKYLPPSIAMRQGLQAFTERFFAMNWVILGECQL
jgi:hypothetical protein